MSKIFCGDGKEFGQYGSIKVSVCLSDLPKEFIKQAKNGKKYISLVLNKKREADQYGKTHYLEVDTWKPDSQGQQQAQEPDDCPF